jgi:putative endonuclease
MCMSSRQGRLRDSLDSLLSVRAARGRDGRPRDHRRALGRYGEKLALDHLGARGFTVLARNYRTRRGEIDLIAFDGRTLIFVEVKTHQLGRSQPPASVKPLAYLSAGQLARYRPVAQAWLDDERYTTPEPQSMRFDAIGVLVDAEGTVVDLMHVEGSG